MSTEKKYESFGVDKEKQQSEPTLVEKAQQAEAKAKAEKGSGALVSPEEVSRVASETTTNHQRFVFDQKRGDGGLEKALHGIGSDEKAGEAEKKKEAEEKK